jgi:UDP-GlcNAc:undecaprenyl-phosphate GlcNAc-1-phosphate transferase
MAVPLFDMLLVVLSRSLGGRPVYQGGTDHSSHRLARLGLSVPAVAAVTYLVQGACVGLAVWVSRSTSVPLAAPVDSVVGLAFVAILITFIASERPTVAPHLRPVPTERDTEDAAYTLEEMKSAEGS